MPALAIDLPHNDPSKYDGTIMRVDGTVVGSLWVIGFGAFRLQDSQSGREILVVSSGGIPAHGTAISIFGKFNRVKRMERGADPSCFGGKDWFRISASVKWSV